jgi:hypothetical protein
MRLEAAVKKGKLYGAPVTHTHACLAFCAYLRYVHKSIILTSSIDLT